MKKPTNDYPYVRAWNKYLKSSKTYIEKQVKYAREEKPPEKAIWRSTMEEGVWITLDAEFVAPKVRKIIEKEVKKLGKDTNGSDLTSVSGRRRRSSSV